ncbi:hypothetical protein DSCW_19780 [Desulfosarcina widdelii]|uniref:DUF1848 domain-containing protein n=1 Tax=Desulfosarcina widdelii TaxID=947919 RepID=A0A5K7Z4N5_9BACT|nr:DUF1848 domain-containing protein [Desulfosarcina widdelii]BBO74561.1 hypothetical protein DSCW_19780 [Desulfosarcina widdelii]
MKTEQIAVFPMVEAFQEPCSQSHEPKGLGQTDSKGRCSLMIHNDAGEACTATSSLIVSASRKTDIPAHYSDWFMERLRRGHLMVNFPIKRYISFARTRLIVFWTKNPLPLMRHLDEIDAKGLNYYFQFTLNDYEQEGLEPNVPPLAERIDTFKKISDRIGKEKVIWRFDPLILTDTIDRERLIGKICSLMQALAGHTEKMVFSFLHPATHKKAERKLEKAGINAKSFSDDEKAYVAWHIAEMAAENGIQAAACAEAMDLAPMGIIRNKCIDDGLIRRLFSHDHELMAFVNDGNGLSDKGQRPLCGCIPSIDIGTYDTCRHYCRYCYANVSETAVENKLKRISPTGELLVPPVAD